MSLKILRNNLPLMVALIEGVKIEFRLSPKFEWEEFIFDHHTLDLFDRCNNFRLKENDVTIKTAPLKPGCV